MTCVSTDAQDRLIDMNPDPLPPRRLARLLPAPLRRSAGWLSCGSRERLDRVRARVLEESGVTMFEMLVTMAVLATVGGALTSVITAATKAEVRTNRSFQAQVQGRIALDKLRRELRCANSVTVLNASGQTVAAGTSGTRINLLLGGFCPTNGLTSNASSTVYVTWCTATSTLKTGTFALFRSSSLSSQPACSTSGAKWADYLTASTPFCLPSTTTACGGVLKAVATLPTLYVSLPINLNGPGVVSETFNLVDHIALRNSARD